MAERPTSGFAVVELLVDGDAARGPLVPANSGLVQQHHERVTAGRDVGERGAGSLLERTESDPEHRFVGLGAKQPIASHRDGRGRNGGI